MFILIILQEDDAITLLPRQNEKNPFIPAASKLETQVVFCLVSRQGESGTQFSVFAAKAGELKVNFCWNFPDRF